MDYLAHGMSHKYSTPSAESRVSFYIAFDYTPDEQEALERSYDRITPHHQKLGAPIDYKYNRHYLQS